MSDWAFLEWTSSGYTTSGQWLDSAQFPGMCARIRVRFVSPIQPRGPMRNHLVIAIGALMAPISAHSQAISAPFEPQVAVSARGEVRVSPDRATIQVSVQTRAPTA